MRGTGKLSRKVYSSTPTEAMGTRNDTARKTRKFYYESEGHEETPHRALTVV